MGSVGPHPRHNMCHKPSLAHNLCSPSMPHIIIGYTFPDFFHSRDPGVGPGFHIITMKSPGYPVMDTLPNITLLMKH